MDFALARSRLFVSVDHGTMLDSEIGRYLSRHGHHRHILCHYDLVQHPLSCAFLVVAKFEGFF